MVLIAKLMRPSFRVASITSNYIKSTANINRLRCFSLSSVYNADRRYTDKHEWITIDGDIGIIGISQYAQETLGDVVYAQLPDIGMKLKLHDECGALESVKAASEVYSPVSGVVTEKNVEVENAPGLINSNCYDKGWLFKLKLTDIKELDSLMDEKQYEDFIKSSEH